MPTERNHAEENAEAWMGTIREYVEGMQAFEDGEETVTAGGDEFTDVDDLRERIQESPLSVEVRSGWNSPGSFDRNPCAEEFKILLSTGGPALRIIGELCKHAEPTSASLEYQDWGTPWTPLWLSAEDEATLLSFCSHFYFGE